MSDRVDRVRSFFDEPDRYLGPRGNFNLRLRAEVVQTMVAHAPPTSILDIGCGNGAMSLPLLRDGVHLTLLDVSAAMLEIARAGVPASRREQVSFINQDVMAAPLERGSYDLVLCLGVLAHVDDPAGLIARMSTLIRPGGRIIVQNNDAGHPIGYLNALYASVSRRLRQERYQLNRIASTTVIEEFRRHGLRVASSYRYNLPPPGLTWVVSGDQVYRMIRAIHGPNEDTRRAWLGSEHLLELQR